jgi:TolB protein
MLRKLFSLPAFALIAIAAEPNLGIFESSTDIGSPSRKGSVTYEDGAYRISGGGANMWARQDALHFVYKKATGDVTISADIKMESTGGDNHRKAVLMIRQSLDPDAAYADAALHGDGLTSLQSRETKGDLTHEIQTNQSGPTRIKLEKRGNYVSMWIAKSGEPFRRAGGAMKLPLEGPFLIGLGVCAHNDANLETASFSNVILEGEQKLISTLETITVSSTDRRVVEVFNSHIEAPNWTPDGKHLLYNGGGKLYKIPATGGAPELIDTGFANRLNNDHGISPDGKFLAISDSTRESRRSAIYVLPITGGTPRPVTTKTPSYWHGWSMDGKTLAYCADRNGNYDIYTIPVDGGEETRLTTAEGLDDGPEYSPDGQHIYFNSVRTGRMQIWRMKPDGSNQEQLTFDDANNWFPHISPDNKRMVFITFDKEVTGHPPNKEVMLRLMDLSTNKVTILAKLFGGQGTINVPSWSPDSKRLAFVSYQLLP